MTEVTFYVVGKPAAVFQTAADPDGAASAFGSVRVLQLEPTDSLAVGPTILFHTHIALSGVIEL
jgi:hypothetical protein